MAPVGLMPAAHCDTPTFDQHHLALAQSQVTAVAEPPKSPERTQVDLALTLMDLRLGDLEAKFEVLTATVTGEYPAITTRPVYDVAGLEAEPGFSMSVAEAAAIGRSLQRDVEDDSVDGDFSY